MYKNILARELEASGKSNTFEIRIEIKRAVDTIKKFIEERFYILDGRNGFEKSDTNQNGDIRQLKAEIKELRSEMKIANGNLKSLYNVMIKFSK